jgi:hypothetical protein
MQIFQRSENHIHLNHIKSELLGFFNKSLTVLHDYQPLFYEGVWTDGSWVFSTGLDQRVRCWHLLQSKLIERAHLIVSVPEPEALSARAYSR